MARENSQDAITEEEIAGTANSKPSSSSNAFTNLMQKSKRKASSPASSSSSSSSKPKKSHSKNAFVGGRDGLGAYLRDPNSYGPKVLIFHNPNFVAIHDLYPKSSVHTLLLPRSTKHNYLHPFDAFEDAEFLALVKAETKRLEKIVARELQRKYGPYSKQDETREAMLNGDIPLPEDGQLPIGRDWSKEVVSGVHAHPSMNHLHVHVMSVDRYSECLKHRKHYNSFATGFFVPVEDFPLAKDDPRRGAGEQGYLKMDFKCWRCGEGFGNQFAKLKEHLKEEFLEWRRL